MSAFDFRQCSPEDRNIARRYIGDLLRPADLIIQDDRANVYLWRWHVLRRLSGDADFGGNIYFHIQTASDPERPLHDHPWDNMSVILAGGYDEVMQEKMGVPLTFERRKGSVIFRKATQLHRLELPRDILYTMTQFTTGPYLRKWGFQIGTRWYAHDACTRELGDGRVVFQYPPGSQEAA